MNNKNKLTISDIAKLAETSKTTISFYLNGRFDKMSEATKQRIEKVIESNHYTPNYAARMLNLKHSRTIGVIIGDITNGFSNQMVKGISERANENKYQLVIGNSNYQNDEEYAYICNMLSMGVDGFIIQPTHQFSEGLDLIKSKNKPVVFIDSDLDTQEVSIKANTYDSCQQITKKMIDVGYDEYIIITADPSVLSTREERLNGVVDVLKWHQKPYKVKTIEPTVTPTQIKAYLTENLSLGKKTCIFSLNCWLLPIVFQSLQEYKNLIPETIGLIGFDNTEWTQFSSPSITTIVQPSKMEGVLACECLLKLIDEEEVDSGAHYIDCDIQYQASTMRKN